MVDLALPDTSFDDWKGMVLARYPDAAFTLEDGSGRTYGSVGDWTAHIGPDMQSDVVGVYAPSSSHASVFDLDLDGD